MIVYHMDRNLILQQAL
jgi:hypothetical protein